MKLSFTKMHGCANDYIYLDCRATGLPQNIEALARKLSARRFSIGGDGIICICAPQTPSADATMRIFNADGSEGKMCGNGIRCVAQWLREHEASCAAKDPLTIDTLSGPKVLRYQGGGSWQVDMGRYSAMAADLPAVNMGPGPLVRYPLAVADHSWEVTCISVGNPHCVIFGEDPDGLDLPEIGPLFEHDPLFPQGVNTEFIQVLDSRTLKMRVWERGSGETMACGTGACASAVAAILCGHCNEGEDILVRLRGGDLTIRVEGSRVWMTGEAVTVFEGTVTV